MRKFFFLLSLLLCVTAARAQHGMQVWQNGQCVFFPIANVDSVRFVCLVTDIYLSQESMELKEGETKQLTVSVYPIDADDKAVTWESSVPTVAAVEQTGKVTAVAAGSCVITCRATDGSGVKAECQVTVTKAGGDTGLLTCPDDNHPHAIDLGLPSGTKWCCCNVGASTPEGYGGYYAWGETSEKDYYETNKYYKDTGDSWGWTKYCTSSSYGYNGFTDGKTELDLSDDVAHVRMGAPWRMPSHDQQTELMNNCSRQWTQQNGINGILVTGRNGGQIFLPAAGGRWDGELYGAGSDGHYWSSSLYPHYDYGAYSLYFSFGDWYWDDIYRGDGPSVRAVRP